MPDKTETPLVDQLVNILIRYVGERGDSEGSVEVLRRIIRERNEAEQRA